MGGRGFDKGGDIRPGGRTRTKGGIAQQHLPEKPVSAIHHTDGTSLQVEVLLLRKPLEAAVAAAVTARLAVNGSTGDDPATQNGELGGVALDELVAEMAVFRHKALAGGSKARGGKKAGAKTLKAGTKATKAELIEVFGTPDVEACVQIVALDFVRKMARDRARTLARTELLSVGTGNRLWSGSALSRQHRFLWSLATHGWLSAERRGWVEAVMLIGQRLQEQAHARRASTSVEVGHGGVDRALWSDAGSGSDRLVVAAALPTELWLAVMQCVRRSEMVGTASTTACGHGKRRGRRPKQRRPSESAESDGDHDL